MESAIHPVVQFIGKFASGEIPVPVVHQFKLGGSPLDITGFTAQAYIISVLAKPNLGQGTVTVLDGANGLVEYSFTENDMLEPGAYRLQFWVTSADETLRYASDFFSFEVYRSTHPTE